MRKLYLISQIGCTNTTHGRGKPTDVSTFSCHFVFLFYYYFVPHFNARSSVLGVHSLASSFVFALFPALAIFQQKYLLVPSFLVGQYCFIITILFYASMYIIELVELGVWWIMPVCFFPSPPDTWRGNKNREKTYWSTRHY